MTIIYVGYRSTGVPLLVLDVQVDAIPLMKTWTKPGDNYVEITGKGNVIISFEQSRQILGQMGIAGEIVHTPGHSDHSRRQTPNDFRRATRF